MADYFLVLDPASFTGRVRPALAACWRRRSFAPAVALGQSLLGAARSFAERYHLGPLEPLLAPLARGELAFDRAVWRAVVGEVLLFSALEIPELPDSAATLLWLLSPGRGRADSRERAAPIEQALFGAGDVTFGAAVYRPEKAGRNDPADVARLAAWLDGVDPDAWRPADLDGLPGTDEEDRADELDWARAGFDALRGLYRRCRDEGRMLVIEAVQG